MIEIEEEIYIEIQQLTEESSFNFSVDKDLIAKSLSHIQTLVERKNVLPILGNVLLEILDDNLRITATDMDIVVTEIIPIKTKEKGSLTLSAHDLYEVVKKMPSNQSIEFSIDHKLPGKVKIQNGVIIFHLSFLESNIFPVFENDNLPNIFYIESNKLKKLIEKTESCICLEETRFSLTGIYFHIVDGRLRSVATDCHRIAICEVDIEANQFYSFTLPKKSAIEFRKILDDVNGLIEINQSENKMKFSIENIVFSTKLIDINFPDYDNIIINDHNFLLSINKHELITSIDRVTVLVSYDKSKPVKFNFTNSILELLVNNTDNSKASEIIQINSDIESYYNSFNSKYLLDALNSIDGDVVNISFNTFNGDSSTIQISSPLDNSYKYIIMPLRG